MGGLRPYATPSRAHLSPAEAAADYRLLVAAIAITILSRQYEGLRSALYFERR
jgi:hypothetical protein